MTPGPVLPTTLASAVLAPSGPRQPPPGLADGTTPAAVALEAGTLTGTRDAEGNLAVEGESAPALGGRVADVLLLPVVTDSGAVWVVVGREAVDRDDDRPATT